MELSLNFPAVHKRLTSTNLCIIPECLLIQLINYNMEIIIFKTIM